MSEFDLFTIITATVSIVLAVVAIVISFAFYWMSTKQEGRNQVVSQDVAVTMAQMQIILDKLHGETFAAYRSMSERALEQAAGTGTVSPAVIEKMQREMDEKREQDKAEFREELIRTSEKIGLSKEGQDEAVNKLESLVESRMEQEAVRRSQDRVEIAKANIRSLLSGGGEGRPGFTNKEISKAILSGPGISYTVSNIHKALHLPVDVFEEALEQMKSNDEILISAGLFSLNEDGNVRMVSKEFGSGRYQAGSFVLPQEEMFREMRKV